MCTFDKNWCPYGKSPSDVNTWFTEGLMDLDTYIKDSHLNTESSPTIVFPGI